MGLEERECLASASVSDLSPSRGVVPPAMGGDLIAPSRVASDLAQPRPQEALAKVVFVQSVGAAAARSDFCCAVTDAQKQHLRRMNSNVLDAPWERRDSTTFLSASAASSGHPPLILCVGTRGCW